MELTIQVASQEEAMVLFGLGDRNLRLLREASGVQISARSGVIRLSGERAPLERVAGILNRMISLHRNGASLPENFVERQIRERQGAGGPADRLECPDDPDDGERRGEGGDLPLPGRQEAALLAPSLSPQAREGGEPGGAIEDEGESAARGGLGRESGLSALERSAVKGLARSRGQEAYLQAILRNDLVFCIGPAGTGKTFLAVRMAVNALRAGEIRRIVLCRPAVEAGEKLGFLPGDFQAKINPYLRPLYDALNDILDYDQVKRYVDREIIEVIPLAFMRGRTLNNAFIILDEGQNTTISQMKMFLTRLGMNSKVVVNGDITQVDLPEGQPSGLIHAERIIRSIPGIAWIRLEKVDIVRHPLVKHIVEAYEAADEAR
jgi:phosphate starvation-inducible PhoH-like protein